MAQARKVRHRQKPETAREPTPGWAWLLLGMLIGLGIAAILYLQGADRWRLDLSWLGEPGTGVPTGSGSPPASGNVLAEPEPVSPRFQFYDLLPKAEIVVPLPPAGPAGTDSAAERPATIQGRPATTGPDGSGQAALPTPQLLQTGSFRRFEQADELKAQLAFLGLQARIEEVRIGGQDFHRVFVGPFTTEAQLRRTEERLRNANIEALRRPAS